MREFKIKVVLPAFSGFVPDEIQEIFPNIKLYQGGSWNNFLPQYT